MVDPDAINEERLRLVGKRLGSLGQIRAGQPFPREKPDRLVVSLLASQYPDPIEEVRIEARLRFSGDFNVLYIEDWQNEQWCCRWDRHENPHNTRDHIHVPPAIESDRAVDAESDDDPNRIIGRVLSFVEYRRKDLWDGPLTYPSEFLYGESAYQSLW